jgi:hypothetical protein
MARSIDHLIETTPRGVRIKIKALYVYPDGHANLTFADETNWPMADQYQAMQLLSGELMRVMEKRAKSAHKKP